MLQTDFVVVLLESKNACSHSNTLLQVAAFWKTIICFSCQVKHMKIFYRKRLILDFQWSDSDEGSACTEEAPWSLWGGSVWEEECLYRCPEVLCALNYHRDWKYTLVIYWSFFPLIISVVWWHPRSLNYQDFFFTRGWRGGWECLYLSSKTSISSSIAVPLHTSGEGTFPSPPPITLPEPEQQLNP